MNHLQVHMHMLSLILQAVACVRTVQIMLVEVLANNYNNVYFGSNVLESILIGIVLSACKHFCQCLVFIISKHFSNCLVLVACELFLKVIA